jgi:hypothetical protein
VVCEALVAIRASSLQSWSQEQPDERNDYPMLGWLVRDDDRRQAGEHAAYTVADRNLSTEDLRASGAAQWRMGPRAGEMLW